MYEGLQPAWILGKLADFKHVKRCFVEVRTFLDEVASYYDVERRCTEGEQRLNDVLTFSERVPSLLSLVHGSVGREFGSGSTSRASKVF